MNKYNKLTSFPLHHRPNLFPWVLEYRILKNFANRISKFGDLLTEIVSGEGGCRNKPGCVCLVCVCVFLVDNVGEGLGAYNKAPTKEIVEKRERLDGKGDKVKFVDVRCETRQVVGFGEGSRRKGVEKFLEMNDDFWAVCECMCVCVFCD